jgi:hypothetical protein
MKIEHTNQAGYDEVVINIGLEWLVQYARFLRRSPELIEGLRDRPDDFEVIPIPKIVLERLAVPGILGSGSLGAQDPEIHRLIEFDLAALSQKVPAASREAALNVIYRFASAIDTGDSARAGALLSSRFLNPDGKDAAEVHATLRRLFDRTSNRRFEIVAIEDRHASELEFGARVTAKWSASTGGGDTLTETVCLDILLERQSDGDWTILAARSV